MDDMLVKSRAITDYMYHLGFFFPFKKISDEVQPPEVCVWSRIREIPWFYDQSAMNKGQP